MILGRNPENFSASKSQVCGKYLESQWLFYPEVEVFVQKRACSISSALYNISTYYEQGEKR
jgi:hypothetical protein